MHRLRLIVLAACAALVAGCSHDEHAATPPSGVRALDPQHLPALPREVLAVQRGGAAVLVRLDGSVIGRLEGYRVDRGGWGGTLDVNGYPYRIERDRRRIVPGGARATSASAIAFSGNMSVPRCKHLEPIAELGSDDLLSCYGRPGGRPGTLWRLMGFDFTMLVPAPAGARVGRWTTVLVSPDRKRLLLQWSGECGAPTAYLAPAAGGPPRSVTPGSVALGWSRTGRAFVLVQRGGCGAGPKPPGVYAAGVPGLGLVARGSDALLLHL